MEHWQDLKYKYSNKLDDGDYWIKFGLFVYQHFMDYLMLKFDISFKKGFTLLKEMQLAYSKPKQQGEVLIRVKEVI